jgi:hypothetical protein
MFPRLFNKEGRTFWAAWGIPAIPDGKGCPGT